MHGANSEVDTLTASLIVASTVHETFRCVLGLQCPCVAGRLANPTAAAHRNMQNSHDVIDMQI